MEYNTFLEWSVDFLQPTPPTDFVNFVKANPNLMEEFADFLMYTLPSPRYKWY